MIFEQLAPELSTKKAVRFAGARHLGDGAVELAAMVRESDQRKYFKRRFEFGAHQSVKEVAEHIVDYFTRRAFLSDRDATSKVYSSDA